MILENLRRLILDSAAGLSRLERMKLIVEYGEIRRTVDDLSLNRLERMRAIVRANEIRALLLGEKAGETEGAPLEQGPWGPIFSGYENQPERAISKLMAEKRGEVPDAFVHEELGPIAFVYGDETMGLAHIEDKRGIEFVMRIPSVLKYGRVERDPKYPRAYVVDDADPANVAVIRLDWDGQSKVWLVTLYPDEQRKFVRQARTSNVPPEQTSTRIPDVTGQENFSTSEETDRDLSAPEIAEHVTKKGKVIRGVIRRDLDRNSARALDPYTFRKDDGWFIREQHLSDAPSTVSTPSTDEPHEAVPKPVESATANKKHAVDRREVLTPAGALSADARRSRADTAPWYYQGDIGQLSFTANVTIGGQPDPRADIARDMLEKLKAAKAQGWTRTSVRAGSLGTVWMLEKNKQFLTRSGFDNLTNAVFLRPDMPEPTSGFTNMLESQTALARGFQAWLDTLPEDQRQNRAVVVRKMNETPIGQWARLQDNGIGEPVLSYLHEDRQEGIRIIQPDFPSLLAEVARLARGGLSRYEQNALAIERLEDETDPYQARLAELESRALRFGRAKIEDEARSMLAGAALGRDFQESVEDFYARKPDLKTKADATRAWLNGEKPSISLPTPVDSGKKFDLKFLQSVIDGGADFYDAGVTDRLASIAESRADDPEIAPLIQQAKTAAKTWFVAEFKRKTEGMAV